MAGQLRQRWNPNVWRPLARLLAKGPLTTPVTPPPAPTERQRQVRLSPAQIDAFIADYAAGSSVAEVAHRYGICLKTATKHLNDHGIVIRQQHGIPADQLEDARRLRAEGWTYKQIGDRYGCSRTTVANQLKAQV